MTAAVARGAPPFGLYERLLAGRYLLATRHDLGVLVVSILAFVAILASVFVLITTMSVMNGFRETLLSRILGVNGHVYVDLPGAGPEERSQIERLAAGAPGVVHVAALVEGQVLASAGAAAAGAYVRGIPAQELAALPIVANNLVAGSLDGFAVDAEGQGGVLLGSGLAASLGLQVGDPVTFLSPQGAAGPFGTVPRRKTYTVAGVFSVGMSEYDGVIAYLPLGEAQLFFNRGETVDRIEIRVADPDQVDATARALRLALPGSAYVSDWKDQNASLVGALVVERNVMRLILMMIVGIASLTIISSMVMLVKIKSKDIAILRTMGATQGAILRIFLMAGATLGVLGAFTGVALATIFCLNIGPIQDAVSQLIGRPIFPGDVYSLSRLPAVVEWGEVIGTALFAFLMACLATLLPAWLGSRLDPVEALRYE